MSKNSQLDKDITRANTNKRKIVNDKEEGEESSDDESQSKRQKLNQKKSKKNEVVETVPNKRSNKKSKANSDSSSSSSSSSSASSSSSEDSNDEDGANNDTDEIKVNKTKARLASLKKKYDETKHKSEKIERALIKAENENNKENVVKCKKYKKLYDQKVKDLKASLKHVKSKLDKYVEIVNAKNKKPQTDSTQTKKTPQTQQQQASNEKQIVSKDSSSSLSTQKETKPVQPQQTVLKLPFPVLNDTRDFQTILKTLETKYLELQNKKEVNKKSIDTFSLYTSDKKLMEKNQQSLDKLKQLDKSISLLIQRLVKQMDYLKMSLKLESVKSRNLMTDSEMVARMSHTLNEMFNYMKNENKEYILKQKKLTEPSEPENQGNQQPEESSPMTKLNELYDQVNKALTAVLAHTAACAHSSAAINAYNYSIYYQQQLKQQEITGSVVVSKDELEEIKSPVVPLKTELKNASSKFSLFKEKISSFFRTTKKMNNEKVISTPIISTKKDGLNKLIADYDQDDDDDDDDHNKTSESDIKIKQPNFNETQQLISKKSSLINLEDDDESYTDDEDDLVGDSIVFNDLDKNCDLEIITTSELKQFGYYKKRNYLLPSLKAINFPLKASLSFRDPSRFIKKAPDTLIAVEKSKCGLTFLGNSNKYNNSFGQKRNKLYEILYSQQQK